MASGGKHLVYDNGDLFIRQVNAADTGTYTCEAANEHGKAESTGKLVNENFFFRNIAPHACLLTVCRS